MEDLSQDDFDQGETDRDPDEGGEEEQQEDGGARQHQRLFESYQRVARGSDVTWSPPKSSVRRREQASDVGKPISRSS